MYENTVFYKQLIQIVTFPYYEFMVIAFIQCLIAMYFLYFW